MITVIAFLVSGLCFYILGRRNGKRALLKKQEKDTELMIESITGFKRLATESMEQLRERTNHCIKNPPGLGR